MKSLPADKTVLDETERKTINDFVGDYYDNIRPANFGAIEEDYLIGTMTQIYPDYGIGVFSKGKKD